MKSVMDNLSATDSPRACTSLESSRTPLLSDSENEQFLGFSASRRRSSPCGSRSRTIQGFCTIRWWGRFATWDEVIREREACVSAKVDYDKFCKTISRCNHKEFGYGHVHSMFLTRLTGLQAMTTHAIGVTASCHDHGWYEYTVPNENGIVVVMFNKMYFVLHDIRLPDGPDWDRRADQSDLRR